MKLHADTTTTACALHASDNEPMWRRNGALPYQVATALILALLIWVVSSARGAVNGVGTITLTVENLEREVAFYTEVLPFERVGENHDSGKETEALFDLPGAHTRTVLLALGRETIALREFVGLKGRPIPADSRSFDHWFQHIAIVVRDMDAAYAHLAKHRIRHVSTAPQTLPDWNPDAGGIKAFYFQDPEQHVLEIIWFLPGKGDPRWQEPADRLFLGIDHTAIVVSDTERSLAFYRDALGLSVAGGAENHGTEQEHLNQVFGARLRITALRAAKGPGIEFLEYITPPGGRPLFADARANDLVAWTVDLNAANVPAIDPAIVAAGGRTVSRRGAFSRRLVRDPDGHLLLLAP